MACTGIEFCKLAIVETKGRAVELYRYLEERLPGLRRRGPHQRERVPQLVRPLPDRRHRPDGLRRAPRRSWSSDHDGNQVEERRKVEAFLVHLGGHLGEDRGVRTQGPRA